MKFSSIHGKSLAVGAINFLAWSLIFGVIYAQSPLYTSNQNQYFLHGLSLAGYGYLRLDWLANTFDPTPVFSWLVQVSYQAFNTDLIFYLYYALLMGIYLFSLLGICTWLFPPENGKTVILYTAVLLALNSAAARFLLSRTIGVDWTYILEGGVANQRVLGAVLEPSCFGVFLLLSISLFLRNRFFLAALACALAVAFHPTYLLSAALLTLAYLWVLFREHKDASRAAKFGLLQLLLVSPIVFYVFSTFSPGTSQIAVQADQILVEYRIPHHAVVGDWFNLTTIVQILFLLGVLSLTRKARMFPILAIPGSIAALLTLVQVISGSAALALLFPWRISVVLVPLSVAILAIYLLTSIPQWIKIKSTRFRNGPFLLSVALIVLLVLVGATRFTLDLERKAAIPERDLMSFVSAKKSAKDVYLTPIKMQDFRLATGAPVYVDFKAIPYEPSEVLEWYRRIRLATDFYEGRGDICSKLEAFAQEGVTQVVLENNGRAPTCNILEQSYQDSAFSVYDLQP